MSKFVMYSPCESWKKGDSPVSPYVTVAVGECVKSDGFTHLSSHLMTNDEIDFEVDRLIKELEAFKVKAKKELTKLKAKMSRPTV